MLKVVSDESAIRRYQRQFARALKATGGQTIPVKLGHPGASEKAKVAWSEDLGIWFFSRKIPGSRYWNGFGVGRPESGDNVAITCEINFPLCGIDRRTGGAFAQDRSGRIFVVHRGKLGGGRRGIGKSLFESRYRGVWKVMDDAGEETTVAVIGVLHSPRFARQIALFVRKIALLKEAAATPSPQTELSLEERRVREEMIGEELGDAASETGAECDQGLILKDLSEALKKVGLSTTNDDRRDLVIVDRKGRMRAVFEVLTEATLPEFHAGAAQLLLNGPNLQENPLLVLVLPEPPEGELEERLKRLNIHLLLYRWEEDRAVFPRLDPLLSHIH